MKFEKQKAILGDFFGVANPIKSNHEHLIKSVEWLCKAQDATPDDGVSRMYQLSKGWGSSYPETTGYIIPTMLQYGEYYNNNDVVSRAERMTKWLQKIQHASGYIQGGTITDEQSPAIFNTGQVLFGYCAAYESFKDESVRISALRAADYLLSQQDNDGHWRKNLSRFCTPDSEFFSFNIRTAWALCRTAIVFNEKKYEQSARRNFEVIHSLASEVGWFENNCLTLSDNPLLHTIAYTLQGLLEMSVLFDANDALQTVQTACQKIMDNFKQRNSLYGRYNKDWLPTVKWRCLTGEAQMSCIWLRLYYLTNNIEFKNNALLLLKMLKQTQCLESKNVNIVGGIKGSFPVYGDYGKYEYPNWAAKFFVDALMLEDEYKLASTTG